MPPTEGVNRRGESGDSVSSSPDVTMGDLSHEEFSRWSTETGYGELTLILLFRWDPDGVVTDYPDSTDAYHDEARSIVLGLWMKDGEKAFERRLLHKQRHRTTGFSADSLAELWEIVGHWMPISITRWWRADVMRTARNLPFHCHLIKYDPDRAINHDDDGTWTSISDVGTSFDGIVLTREQYLSVEQAHLDAIRVMAQESRVTRFRAGVERGSTMGLEEMLEEVRNALREAERAGYWWNSEDLNFYVNVGWDYHVYVGSHTECPLGIKAAVEAGLHPRRAEGPSPYLRP